MDRKQKIDYILKRCRRNETTIANVFGIISSSPKEEQGELFEIFSKKYLSGDYFDEMELPPAFADSTLRKIKFDLDSAQKINDFAKKLGSNNPPTSIFYEKIFSFINDDNNFNLLERKIAAIQSFLSNEYAFYYHIEDLEPIRLDIYGGDKVLLEDELLKARRIIYDPELQYSLNRGSLIYDILKTIPEESGLRSTFLEEVFQMVENNIANVFAAKLIDNE